MRYLENESQQSLSETNLAADRRMRSFIEDLDRKGVTRMWEPKFVPNFHSAIGGTESKVVFLDPRQLIK
ncbi:MAG TPA: hypothetical protein VMR41_03810 [Patescibacteria group bacterium]|nr:hypothetical protein [Patescibacteria group bacterium]